MHLLEGDDMIGGTTGPNEEAGLVVTVVVIVFSWLVPGELPWPIDLRYVPFNGAKPFPFTL